MLMTMKKLYPAILAVASLTLSACANNTDQNQTDAASALTAYHWHIDQALDAKGNSDSLWLRTKERNIDATLAFGDNNVGVSGLCNLMGADYTIDKSQIVIAPFISTMRMCDDQLLMQYERSVAQRLEGTSAWSIKSTEDNKAQLSLTFADGGKWLLKGEPTAETRYGSQGEIVFLEVAPKTVPCTDTTKEQCLQIRTVNYDAQGIKEGHGAWSKFAGTIENYQHTPGVRNILRVKQYELKEPQADGVTHAYVLDMIVESEL